MLATFINGLLLTGMRCGELAGMTSGQVDFENRIMARGKTDAGTGRHIPIDPELREVMTDHPRWFTQRFRQTLPKQNGHQSNPRSESETADSSQRKWF